MSAPAGWVRLGLTHDEQTYVWVATLMGVGGAIELWTCSGCFGLVGEAPGANAGRQGHDRWHRGDKS